MTRDEAVPATEADTPPTALPNVPAEPLDDLDRALVERLRIDGRETNRALAQALGVNEVTVATRLRRMEQNSIMRVVAVTDMRIFGHREFAFACLRVSDHPVLKVGTDVAELPEVVAVTISTGRYDLIVPVLGRDHGHLAELFGATLPRIPGVEEVRGHLVLDVLKFDSKWALLAADPGSTPDTHPSDTADELDIAIIEKLQVDARRSNRSIAAELGVSEGTIRTRIKHLLTHRVIRIQAISDVLAFGMAAHAYVGIKTHGGHADDVARSLIARDDVAQLSRTLGEFDFIATVIAPTREQLVAAVVNEISQIPGLRRTETFETYATTKHTYAWSWLV
ncbi:Lrp/AsnC family transcriptional regulator [Nocardia sp. NBC_00565]|uniref:Lrp/AsnC family transcriptional regulator n=1 Tax=Nocardia sp. NBC_00565 TaxID=2975993 RepID=UPI002E804710|nr:Lrp/AsnC family transcriptional regulator [Nocardia sp. NBC_00565]WUC05573.1 Lrp/AsnC family transcriptional regulator [Nocardia sp. NBC_00565]